MLVVRVLSGGRDTLNSKMPASLIRTLCFSLLSMRTVTSFLVYMAVFFDDIIEMEMQGQLTRFGRRREWRAGGKREVERGRKGYFCFGFWA